MKNKGIWQFKRELTDKMEGEIQYHVNNVMIMKVVDKDVWKIEG